MTIQTIRNKRSTVLHSDAGVTAVYYPVSENSTVYTLEVWKHGKVERDLKFSGTAKEVYDAAAHELRYFGNPEVK